MNKTPYLSDAIYILKAFAMCSIVYAHLSFFTPLTTVMGAVGTMGVPVFLILAGYLTKPEKARFTTVLLKLCKRIIIPWLILGTFTFLTHIIADNASFSFDNYARWILGYLTWLYYVPVYLFCRIVEFFFYRLHRKTIRFVVLSFFISISLLSKYLTQIGILGLGWITPFQNPFNFICYYFIGIVFKRNDCAICEPKNYVELTIVISAIISIALFILRIIISASSIWLVFIKLLMNSSVAVFLFFFSSLIACSSRMQCMRRGLIYIGKRTYLLFFIHMQFGVSLFNLLISRFGFSQHVVNGITLFMPFVILPTLSIIIYATEKLLEKLTLKKYAWLIGMSLVFGSENKTI